MVPFGYRNSNCSNILFIVNAVVIVVTTREVKEITVCKETICQTGGKQAEKSNDRLGGENADHLW